MNIEIPSVLRSHEPTLREFFEGMVFKLAVNAHKDDIDARDIPGLIDLMLDELREFKDEIRPDGTASADALQESFDGANFWYLLFQFLRKQGVPDAREQFLREFFRFDTASGKIFALKNRSGSRYREDDEITGTYRRGRCYIRTQHALTGASVSLPRDHVIWWAHHGRWPVGEIAHLNGDLGDDSISNLAEDYEGTTVREYPFVVQWKPKGKEDSQSYGKWCYQRRHNMILVKVGYYDSAEHAAKQGLIDWKAKIKENRSV